MAKLVVVQGAEAGKEYPITRAVILGRQKGVDILIRDEGTSREHAKVYGQDGDFYVIDLQSRNGTIVEGMRISRRQLNHGDSITVGKTVLRFDAPEIAPPPKTAAPPPAARSPAAAPAPAVAPRGPSALDRERERLRQAAEKKAKTAAGTGARGDDGSGIVVKETVLQYGRIENKSGLLAEDVGQRTGLYKLGLALLLGGFFVSIIFVITRVLVKEPVDEDEPAVVDDGG